MGTAVTIEVRDRRVRRGALARAFAWLRWVDATFSTYSPSSEISRINAGVLAREAAHPRVRDVLARCEALRGETDGYFDMRAPDPPRLDPSGLVKGWAVDEAFGLLMRAGARRVCVEAGGDVRVGGGGWRVGIRHPFARERCAAVLSLDEGAVATSGAYERGEHIIDPVSGEPARGVVSVTLVGRTLAKVDPLATAAFAMGARGPQWSAHLPAMTILSESEALVTPRFDALRCV
jgi:thiamine biosynthesis lipoprotein